MDFWRKIVVISNVLLWSASLNGSASKVARSEDTNCILQKSDETGVTFDYSVPEIEEMTFAFEGQKYHRLRLPGVGCTDQVGGPQLPRVRLLVGVPLEGEVEASLVGSEFEERDGYRVAPVPTLHRPTDDEGSLAAERYIPHPEYYSEDNFYPQRVIEVEKPAFLRNQRVAGIILHPVQFNPVTGALRVHSKISVTLRFRGETVEPITIQKPSVDHFENVYQRVLLNYEVSKRWRKERTLRLEKGSPFQERDWYQISVREDGMYRLDFQDLSEAGIDMATIDPRSVRIFNGGGRELPRNVSEPRPDSLTEMAIAVIGEDDGIFDHEDYIVFYGQGLSWWDYDPVEDDYAYSSHRYTDDNVYWLTFASDGQQGRRMGSRDGSLSASDPRYVRSFRDRTHEERDLEVHYRLKSDWYWGTSTAGETKIYRTEVPGAVQDSLCSVTLRMKGKTRGSLNDHEVKVFFNNHLVAHSSFYSENVLMIQESGRGWIRDGENELKIEHVGGSGSDASSADQIYIDWYEVRYWRDCEGRNGILEFSACRGSEIAEYTISGFSADSILVYDITDPFSVVFLRNISQGELTRFQDAQDPHTEKRYVALTLEGMSSPIGMKEAEDQELRSSLNGADYLILTHDSFTSDVEPLRAHRQNMNGFRTKVVGTTAIYDEFSWGLFDPTAIRDFLKYAFNHWNPQPAYVLFVGDGNYDFKNNSLTSPGNWIPPYENGSEAYDDWFVYLDEGALPDMYIGRLPARSKQQVQAMVEKITDYDTRPTFGQWRSRVLLLADDELVGCREESWNVVHTNDSERVSQESIPDNFEQTKIYLMEYELDQSCEKPDATEDLLTHLNSGVVLFNYIGHGGYNVMADEHVFRSSKEIPRLDNEGKPFLLAAFTCDVGVYDHPIEESMAEDLVRLEGKGAVASIAASRTTSSAPNLDLSQQFYFNLFFGGDGFGMTSSLGEALVEGKVTTSSASNSRLYLLFGDPAQRLGIPRCEVVLTKLQPDTLQALKIITLEGNVVRTDGTVLEHLHGTAMVNVFDSLKDVIHLTPDTEKEVSYQLAGAVLFRGVVPVSNGTFRTQFAIPKDLTYGGATGRITVYVSSDSVDGIGYRDSLFTVGGSIGLVDSVGPLIEMTIRGREETFAEGDYVQPQEVLRATFFDSSGINITGETGHWIVLQTDGDAGTRQDLTPYFVYDEGSFQKGSVEYELSDLTPGDHSVEIKAWDNHNNASVQSLFLRVASSEDFRLLNVMNYPNPFFRETIFTYELTGPARDVIIKIYTVAGRLIRTFTAPGNLGFNQISWEALDEDGDALANGVYLYKVIASGLEGKHHEYIGRLIIMK